MGSVSSTKAARLMQLLGLSEDELCRTLAVDPLTLISGQLDHVRELPILLELAEEAQARVGAHVLRGWLRATGRAGRPIDMLLGRDFAALEDALAELSSSGIVLRSRSRGRD
jgi:hypothetical protein